VLRTSALRTHVAEFATAWHRRLGILGLTGQVTFNDESAVFDVYDAPASSLPHIARALADRGEYALRAPGGRLLSLSSGELTHWKPPTDACQCTAILRVSFARDVLTALADVRGELHLMRAGEPLGQPFPAPRIEWRTDERGVREPIAAEFTTALPEDEARTLALALAGSTLPDTPRLERLTPAGGR
jgi:hypothetical protein